MSEKRPAWACASLSNDNSTGDTPIPGVTITLKHKDGVVVATTTTNTLGVFSFPGLPVGMYTIEQTNPPGFVDVSGGDVPTDSKIMTTSTLDVIGVNYVDKKALQLRQQLSILLPQVCLACQAEAQSKEFLRWDLFAVRSRKMPTTTIVEMSQSPESQSH